MTTCITGADLRRLIDDRESELAVLDLRSPLERTRGHLSVSTGIPYHELEQRVAQAVPRRDTTIVLASGRPLDDTGADILASLGYTDVRVLEKGLESWTQAGGRLYTGTNVRSKTLGEWIEEHFATPTVEAATVAKWREQGEDVVILDSRPHDEYVHHHIPGAFDTGGGAELVYRGLQTLRGPDTKIVVNCAGRTRGIVGAQTLIETGAAPRVYSLHKGTPAWEWAGLALERGAGTSLPAPAEVPDDLRAWARTVLDSAGARIIDDEELARLRADGSRTTCVIDIRSPEEFAAGHVPGSRPVQGGQLLQESDQHLPVHRARIVLVDTEDHVRSAGTVRWLRHLHDGPVHVLPFTGADRTQDVPAFTVPTPDVPTVSAEELLAWISAGDVRVVDLRHSTAYAAAHLPGSLHARREHLPEIVAGAGGARVVFVGDESCLPHFAAAELARRHGVTAHVLDGGAGAPGPRLTADDPRYHAEVADRTGLPDFGPERDRWYAEYFAWEFSLIASATGDPDFGFLGSGS